MRYVLPGTPIKLTEHHGDIVEIPAIEWRDVLQTDRTIIDVTTFDHPSIFRQYQQGPINVRMRDGRSYCMSDQELDLSLRGGGQFYEVHENNIVGCQTREELEDEQKEMAYQDWPW